MKQSRLLAFAAAFFAMALSSCNGGASLPPAPTAPASFDLLRPDAAAAIGSIAWGAMPAGTAGTAFPKAGKPLALTVKNTKGNKLTGTYPKPIAVKDADASGATALTVNGKAVATGKSGSVTKSTDKVALKYSGLAIAAVDLTASATGVKTAKASFAPALKQVVYTGPTAAPTTPEVDLYSNVPATNGFSGNFTATQVGWTNAPYGKAFTQKFATIPSQTNNCPTSNHPAFSVTPASGAKGTAFAISASSQLQAASDPTPFAGECMLTLTGGGAKTVQVVLTYTSSGVVIGGRRAPKP